MEQTIKERLIQFIKYLNLGQTRFEKEVGWANGYVSHIRDGIGSGQLMKLFSKYPELSQDWLINGTGAMIKEYATETDPQSHDQKNVLMVPVINLDARGGYMANEAVDVPQYNVGVLPFSADVARPGDFVMEIHGDSMYPRYPSGSYILLREVQMWREYLELSIPYVLELNDGRRLAKIVMKGEDNTHFVLHSVNPDFQDTSIASSFINKVYMVVMMLKKEIV